MSNFLIIGILSLGIVANAQAQRVVSGTVTSADDGQPLPGVNIIIQGTTVGAVTNAQGEYEINITDDEQVLEFTMVGFQPYETQVGTRSVIDVELEFLVAEIDEVVVTAFGMERERRSLGYSTQTVRSEAFTEARESNVISNLRGRVAGVDITQSPVAGGSSGILIRGVGSLTGDNMPLILVDGVPIDNQQLQAPNVGSGGIDYGDGIGGLNPNEIEEMTVLKGPNAAALYGARAANGAILITTKTGRERSGIGISFNSNVTFDQIGMRPQFQNGFGPGYGLDWDDAYGTTEIDGETYPLINPGVDQHGPPLDGRLVVLQHMPELGPIPATPQPTDNIYDFYNTGITASNSIAFSGGDAATTYRLSISDQRNEGVVPNSKFAQNTVSLSLSTQISDRLSVQGRASYLRHEGTNRPSLGANFSNTFMNLLFIPRFVDLSWYEDYIRQDGSMRHTSTGGVHTNPYWIVNERLNNDTRNRIYGYVSANYNFNDWLSLNIRAGTDTYSDQRFRRAPIGDRGSDFMTGRVENHTFFVQENNYDFLLSANRDLSSDFSSSISFGGNYLFRKNEETGLVGTNLNIPNLYHVDNANSITPRHWISQREMQSLYALGQIGYRDFIYLDVTARNDWSSTLGIGNESFFYPSASLSFVFSDALNISSDILTFGRLRASYAETGNDASPYQTRQGYNISNVDYQGQRMATVPNRIPLLDLKNELTKSWEFGTELRLFDNRLGIDFTTYTSSTLNQIFPVSMSSTTGYTSRLINAGQVDNRGIELSLDATLIQTHNFMWNLGFNTSRNRSEVVELAPGVDTYDITTAGQVTIQARPGEPFGDLMGFVPRRTEEGRLILDQDGTLMREENQQVIGNMTPDFMGGIINEFQYRGFSLGGVIDYRLGGDIVSLTKREGYMKGTGIFTQDRSEEMYFDGVIENLDGDGNWDGTYRENDQPVDPVAYYPVRVWQQYTPFWLVDGTYVNLREITIGYSLQQSLLAQLPFTSMKISLVGRNLAYLYMDDDLRKMGVPPQSANSRDPAGMGYEETNFPLLRTIGFNLNVEF